jgi:long-subunit fatty acid transport protein
MKKLSLTTAAILTAASTAQAGIDRSGQDIGVLFEEGNYVKFSYADVSPNITSDITGTSQSATPFTMVSFGYKHQFNDKLSFALIWDEPYGASVKYIDGPAAGGSADITSRQITGVLRYEMGNGFSVHGGAFSQQISGEIISNNGILDQQSGTEWGGLVGVAYERPEIALRVALTYFTGVDHKLTGTHNFQPATATSSLPEAINLDFQTGIAKDTLLFGSIRHAKYGGVTLNSSSATFGDVEWVRFDDDTTAYELGLGRKLNDQWSVAVSLGYEAGADTGTTFLAPAGASTSIGLGATYTTGDIKISGGVRYTKFDKKTIFGVPFEGDALSVGASVGIGF